MSVNQAKDPMPDRATAELFDGPRLAGNLYDFLCTAFEKYRQAEKGDSWSRADDLIAEGEKRAWGYVLEWWEHHSPDTARKAERAKP